MADSVLFVVPLVCPMLRHDTTYISLYFNILLLCFSRRVSVFSVSVRKAHPPADMLLVEIKTTRNYGLRVGASIHD